MDELSPEITNPILKRQKAFCEGGVHSPTYKLYRNAFNRERKLCNSFFYQSNVENMKETNHRVWRKKVKRLCGFKSNSGNVSERIPIEEIKNLSEQDLANAINKAFLEPVFLEEYRLPQTFTKLAIDEDTPELSDVSEMRISKMLAALNPSKACGPDEIPYWVLKDYAKILSSPISRIINLSLPDIWKYADVSPIPEVKPVEDLKNISDQSLLFHVCRKLPRNV